MIKKGQLVKVSWLDSYASLATWETCGEMDCLEPARCISVGYISHIEKGFITLTPTKSPTQVLGRITIPRGCITKMRRLASDGYKLRLKIERLEALLEIAAEKSSQQSQISLAPSQPFGDNKRMT